MTLRHDIEMHIGFTPSPWADTASPAARGGAMFGDRLVIAIDEQVNTRRRSPIGAPFLPALNGGVSRSYG